MRTIADRFLVGLQYLLPHHALTAMINRIARCRWRWVKNALIGGFSRLYRIDWSEAEHDSAAAYSDFNSFFTRALKAGARPIDRDPGLLLSPCDGTISALGRISNGQLFQVKGRHYSLEQLTAGTAKETDAFRDGWFITIYLSPRNYHRIHMPLAGRLTQMTHVPGRLFSVAPYTVRHVDRLFARNERSLHYFDTDLGPVCIALIGAMMVASMQTVWHGVINPPRATAVKRWDYPLGDQAIELNTGQEMGRFNMGSTVILLLPDNGIRWLDELQADQTLTMGQPIAKRRLPQD